jgi:P27 family predicted phage terminase small subunit
MRGRKPKLTQRQISEGDPRKKGVHKLKEKLLNEPNAKRGLPECPEHLGERGKAAWRFWAKELADMNLDCRPDAMMLEGACANYDRAVDADIMLLKAGIVIEEPITDKEGLVVGYKLKTHPAVAVSFKAWSQVKAFCSDFGLSPVSRTRLDIDKSKNQDSELENLLSAPREQRAPVN